MSKPTHKSAPGPTPAEHGAVPLTISAAAPIDGVIQQKIETIARAGRGFILDLAKEGGTLKIEVVESKPVHDEYLEPLPLRAHVIHDAESLVSYAMRYGDPKRSLVLFNTDKVTLVLDEVPEGGRGERERITMPFLLAAPYVAWGAMINRFLTHKQLMLFLMAQENALNDASILLAMQSVKLNSLVKHESEIKDDGQSVGFFVQTNQGEELKKFPKRFSINLPVLESDIGAKSKASINIDVRLEITLPDDPKGGPVFLLRVPDFEAAKRSRIGEVGGYLATRLKGWTVVQGAHSEVDRDEF